MQSFGRILWVSVYSLEARQLLSRKRSADLLPLTEEVLRRRFFSPSLRGERERCLCLCLLLLLSLSLLCFSFLSLCVLPCLS